jgi:hypothetical protein
VSSQYFRFSTRAIAEPRRAALLEQLVARADVFKASSDWRADAFKILAPQEPSMPSIAAAALRAERMAGDAGDAAAQARWVCLATPVHYIADMTSVRLPLDGILSMPLAAAAALAADFNRVWQDSGCRMIAGGSANLYCIFDQTLDLATRDPEEALERYIEEYLPSGADAPRLRRLMSEMEMWLFGHDANRLRESSSLPPINGLWLWGGGTPLAALPAIRGWIAGTDVFFNAFSAAVTQNTGSGAMTGSGIIIASADPGGEGWGETEQRWLKPALAQLRSGTLSQLEISAGQRCFALTARAARRFWRRRKPWWESFP